MYSREIERKFVVEGLDYDEAYAVLNNRYSCRIDAISSDLYWEAPNVDFIRLRANSRELTIKVTDKGTVTDRIEENAVIEPDSMGAARRAMELLYGDGMKLTKQFSVFDTLSQVGQYDPWAHVIICLYIVAGDPKKRVFLEVEADTMDDVDNVVDNLKSILELSPVISSLYSIFKENL